jgi:hypothetical protein
MNASVTATTNPMQLPHRPQSATFASLSLAAVVTMAMLLGVNTLAVSESAAPQMAQATATHA